MLNMERRSKAFLLLESTEEVLLMTTFIKDLAILLDLQSRMMRVILTTVATRASTLLIQLKRILIFNRDSQLEHKGSNLETTKT